MNALLAIPFVLQGAAMAVDELRFHKRRDLPRWERVGHPLDTATVLACFAVALCAPPTRAWMVAYAALAVFSCAFITKDEPIHARRCTAGEHWLHAALFVLHPVVLGAAALLWWRGARALLAAEAALILVFGAYQLVYWNFVRRPAWR